MFINQIRIGAKGRFGIPGGQKKSLVRKDLSLAEERFRTSPKHPSKPAIHSSIWCKKTSVSGTCHSKLDSMNHMFFYSIVFEHIVI